MAFASSWRCPMRLNPAALSRLSAANPRGEALVTIFEHLLGIAGQIGESQAFLTLGYDNREDEVAEGDFVPVITLSLRKVMPCPISSDGPETSSSSSP